MPVDRCICHNITFSQIKRIVQAREFKTIEELRSKKICSTNCKLCEPYIQRMLQTGETIFQPEISKRVLK